MQSCEVLLRQMDDAWDHTWASVQGSLRGVEEAWAWWQPSAWRDAPREEAWPPAGSVIWHVAHLAHCKRYHRLLLEARGLEAAPAVPPRSSSLALQEEFASLAGAHLQLRSAVAALGDEDLALPLPGDREVLGLLALTIRHDSWHAGQIAALRRCAGVAHGRG